MPENQCLTHLIPVQKGRIVNLDCLGCGLLHTVLVLHDGQLPAQSVCPRCNGVMVTIWNVAQDREPFFVAVFCPPGTPQWLVLTPAQRQMAYHRGLLVQALLTPPILRRFVSRYYDSERYYRTLGAPCQALFSAN
jgi:hypothetical protein